MTVHGPSRICFEFRRGDAYEVEIVDHHKGQATCLPPFIPAVG
jgi:hypothetical protein